MARLVQDIYSANPRLISLAILGTCCVQQFKLGACRSTNRPVVGALFNSIETSSRDICPLALGVPQHCRFPNPRSATLSLGVRDLLDGARYTMGLPSIIASIRKAARELFSGTDVSIV